MSQLDILKDVASVSISPGYLFSSTQLALNIPNLPQTTHDVFATLSDLMLTLAIDEVVLGPPSTDLPAVFVALISKHRSANQRGGMRSPMQNKRRTE
ncbi:hypothetical protein LTR17_021010 [Elasticomyces elasticus]|nr:hypothetical protein LTR17_021010 [Elasticomyces elasticus]